MSGVATQVNISLGSVLTAGQVLTVLGLLSGLYIITLRLAEPILKIFFRAKLAIASPKHTYRSKKKALIAECGFVQS